MPSGWDPCATVRAQPSRRGRYRCDILANGSLASQTGVWVIPTNVLDLAAIQRRSKSMEGGGLSFRSACYYLRYPLLSTPIQELDPSG
jgi:hypothetical protein